MANLSTVLTHQMVRLLAKGYLGFLPSHSLRETSLIVRTLPEHWTIWSGCKLRILHTSDKIMLPKSNENA